VVELLVQERVAHGPYKDILDFLTRLDAKAMNTKLLESLIKAGAFDTMGTNRPTLLENLADTILYVQKRKEATAFGQISLFDEETEASMETFSMKTVEDWKLPEKLEMEKDLLGFYISGHPLDAYSQAIRERVTANTRPSGNNRFQPAYQHHCDGQLDQALHHPEGGHHGLFAAHRPQCNLRCNLVSQDF
jgi:DNA polymerase-3 subunit alpha